MKEKLVLLAFIIMLTGIVHSLVYSSFLVNIVVGLTFFLGVFGLYSIYTSLQIKDRLRCYATLFTGFLCVLIAYFCLELFLILGAY